MTRTKVVVMTGGGTGIGRAAAFRFAKEDFTVVVSGRRAEKIAETRSLAAGTIIPVQGDVGIEADANRIIDEAAHLGEIVYLVTPMGRPGTPAEIADAIYFMGVWATYWNGAVLVVDGGALA